MTITPKDNRLRIPTPQGNEIVARVEDGQVLEPKVVNHDGKMTALGDDIARTLERALQARDISERMMLEAHSIQQTLDGFGKLALALGNSNPAISPYLAQHQVIEKTANEMGTQAQAYFTQAGQSADQLLDRHDPRLHEGNKKWIASTASRAT